MNAHTDDHQFEPETTVWWGIPEFNLLAHNISVPGLSPQFPDVHCTSEYNICQVTTGEGEINAATTIMSMALSPQFDLTKTYFLVAGIGGINPERATIGSATFARYAVQVALQQEIDPRELPPKYSTGYIPQGASRPYQLPGTIYGTEVFEVNADLRSLAVSLAKRADLADSDAAKAYRAKYATANGQYRAATSAPSVELCDVTTSDVYFSGKRLGRAFDRITSVWTNGTGRYCATGQEDNATLEALLRASLRNLADFSRVIVMRTASDFDRPHSNETAADNLLHANQGGFQPAVDNIYRAGVQVVQGIVLSWERTFAAGVKPQNYIGDIWGTLGGTPDLGPGRT